MATGFGYDAWIGFGEESTWGTRAAPTKFIRILDESFKLNNSFIPKPSLGFASHQAARGTLSKKTADGGFSSHFGYSGFETLMKHAMGSVITTNPSGTAYLHTYALASALPTGLTAHVNRAAAAVGTANEYEGSQIEKITFTQEPEEILKVSIEMQSQDEADIAVASPTFPTFVAADWDDFVLTLDTVATTVTSFELTIENTLATDRHQLGSRLRRGLGRSGPRKVTGKFVTEYEDQVIVDLHQAQTGAFGMDATWTGPVITGAHNYTLGITGNIRLTSVERSVTEAGVIQLTAEFEALAGATGNDEIAATIKNTVTTA